MEKIKVSAVSYLNTKPFLYGIENSDILNEIELSVDIPSVCADKLLRGEVYLGLVPVVVIPELNKANLLGQRACLISDFCIGATGPVKTVCIYSQCPIDQVKTLYLDYQSRTSIELTKILLREYWKIEPKLIMAKKEYESKIAKTTAGLIIGDRAIELGMNYEYEYDLAEAWVNMTGLPFVFAAWISNRILPIDFTQRFNEALKYGIDSIPAVTELIKTQYNHRFDLLGYFRNHISYPMDEDKKKGMKMFLRYLAT